MAKIERPTIIAGNDTTLYIRIKEFVEGEYVDVDLTNVSNLKVELLCARDNYKYEIPYRIDETYKNLIICDLKYTYYHSNTSYGIIVTGTNLDEKHWTWCMMPREGFNVVSNTSGLHLTDEAQQLSFNGLVGWGLSTDADLTNYYTKIETNNLLNEKADESELANKQDTLVSGENIKTINNQSVLGSGNISIDIPEQVQSDWNETNTSKPDYIKNKPNLNNYATKSDLNNYYDKGQTDGMLNSKVDTSTLVSEYYNKNTVNNLLDAKANTSDLNDFYDKQETNTLLNQKANVTDLNDKQDTLVSGTNIKTINNQSLLGSGNIDIQGGGGTQVQADWNETDTSDPAYIKNKPDLSIYAESSNLATVATSGDYDDLINKPTIQEPGFVKLTNPNDSSKVGLVNSLSEYYNTNIGNHAVIEGEGNNDNPVRASGNYSHAEGYRTIAGGTYSHAEGWITSASNTNSHAEGSSTTASGTSSHAEGHNNTASGNSSHAEGENTISSGNQSHSEGMDTQATGNHSHAEGKQTYATGLNAHAEGAGNADPRSLPSNTTDTSNNGLEARGEHSHAEGWGTKAYGNKSHAEGERSIASGNMSHAEGFETIASGLNSHAEGLGTRATNDDSHAEGWETQATGHEAHAEGAHTIANGNCSHAEGGDTVTRNLTEHASGRYNISTALGTQDFDPTSDTATLFSVGNGTANERHNAFEIKMNGDIYLNDGTKLQDQLGVGENLDILSLSTINQFNDLYDELNNDFTTKDDVKESLADLETKLNTTIDNTSEVTALALNDLDSELNNKQDTLVSGTNIKTINSQSILGSGDITISGGVQSDWNETGTSSLAYIQNKPTIQEPGFVKVGSGLVSYYSSKYDNPVNGGVIVGKGTSFYKTYAADNSIAFGQACRAVGMYSLAGGNTSYANGYGSVAIGDYAGTSPSVNGAAAFGSYNNYTSTTVFAIGNGTSSSARHNAFEIRTNGDIYLNDGSHPISSTTNGLKIEVVQALPATPDANTIYIIQ